MLRAILLFNLALVQANCTEATLSNHNYSQSDSNQVHSSSMNTDCIVMDFRYLVTENFIQSSNFRRIEVFMDGKAFSEPNLRKLFTYLSDKHPNPEYLTVVVKTNWEQLAFPSDCPGTGSTNLSDPQREIAFDRAIYSRRGQNIYFRYSEAGSEDEKTVVLRGKAE